MIPRTRGTLFTSPDSSQLATMQLPSLDKYLLIPVLFFFTQRLIIQSRLDCWPWVCFWQQYDIDGDPAPNHWDHTVSLKEIFMLGNKMTDLPSSFFHLKMKTVPLLKSPWKTKASKNYFFLKQSFVFKILVWMVEKGSKIADNCTHGLSLGNLAHLNCQQGWLICLASFAVVAVFLWLTAGPSPGDEIQVLPGLTWLW